MRRDLVQKMLGAIQDRLFEDVDVVIDGAAPVTRLKAISGIVVSRERFDEFGVAMRAGTHVTRGLLSALPGLAKGHVLVTEEGQFSVLDFEPVDDGRFEILISLTKLS
ncbi:hypothetical protein [uncultured Devosia sp.]|uniref:hypothetical protein n=1 Tax=uncultured Devosia sp. TaxID=211434 RepID=UPI0026325D10|nr:hypothetical protein [uncultured Devosia sp.]